MTEPAPMAVSSTREPSRVQLAMAPARDFASVCVLTCGTEYRTVASVPCAWLRLQACHLASASVYTMCALSRDHHHILRREACQQRMLLAACCRGGRRAALPTVAGARDYGRMARLQGCCRAVAAP